MINGKILTILALFLNSGFATNSPRPRTNVKQSSSSSSERSSLGSISNSSSDSNTSTKESNNQKLKSFEQFLATNYTKTLKEFNNLAENEQKTIFQNYSDFKYFLENEEELPENITIEQYNQFSEEKKIKLFKGFLEIHKTDKEVEQHRKNSEQLRQEIEQHRKNVKQLDQEIEQLDKKIEQDDIAIKKIKEEIDILTPVILVQLGVFRHPE